MTRQFQILWSIICPRGIQEKRIPTSSTENLSCITDMCNVPVSVRQMFFNHIVLLVIKLFPHCSFYLSAPEEKETNKRMFNAEVGFCSIFNLMSLEMWFLE